MTRDIPKIWVDTENVTIKKNVKLRVHRPQLTVSGGVISTLDYCWRIGNNMVSQMMPHGTNSQNR